MNALVMRLSALLAALRGGFAGNVAMLVGGTVVGHVVTLLVMPVLTRIYPQEAFGALGVLVTTSAVLAVSACLRYELAIPLQSAHRDAVGLVVLSVACATLLSVLVAIALAAVSAFHLGREDLLPPIVRTLLPVTVWVTSLYSIFQYWTIRMSRVGVVARTQATRALGGGGVQIGLGALQAGSVGLMIGHLVSLLIATVVYIAGMLRCDREHLRAFKPADLPRLAASERRFPLFSAPEAILDSAANNLPLVIIGYYAGAAEAGAMFLAQRTCSMPIALIGANVSKIYINEITPRRADGSLGRFTRGIMKRLAAYGLLPFIVLALAGPHLFGLVFGQAWDRAGTMASLLAVALFLQFVVTPVSPILHGTQRQPLALALQAFAFLAMIGSVVLAGSTGGHDLFGVFAVAATVIYIVYAALILSITFKEDR